MRGTSGDLLKDEDILMIILDTSSSSNIYVTTRSKSDPTKVSQYTLTSAFDDEFYVKYQQTNLHSYNVSEGDPIPSQGTRATLAKIIRLLFMVLEEACTLTTFLMHRLNCQPNLSFLILMRKLLV